jgi:Reverse transcriptase (RNA-dependent DNA polymerase)
VTTPQQNSKVERKFQTFFGRIRAILNNAGLEEWIRSGVWAECERNKTFLSNKTALKSREMCPDQLMFGSKPKLPSSLKIFGEMSVVTTKDEIQSKLKNRVMTYMFVGYSVDHANDVYWMLNLKTKRIINTRYVSWLKRSYKTWSKKLIPYNEQEDDNNEDYIDIVDTLNLEERKAEKVQMKRLESSFNPEASKIIESIDQVREIILDQANIALFSGGIQVEPTTYYQAWDHQDPEDQEKWRTAIKKELNNMETEKVWESIKKQDVPVGKRTIKCKWIFKIKRNGILRARLVACSYTQNPGIDFNESFIPVINDVSFRVMLTA